MKLSVSVVGPKCRLVVFVASLGVEETFSTDVTMSNDVVVVKHKVD